MQTPKRTLFTLLLAAALAAGTLAPLASPARAAGSGDPGPVAVAETGPSAGWLSALVERLAGLVGWPDAPVSADSPTPFTSQEGGIADPNGSPASDDDCGDCPDFTTQEGVTADPDG